MRWFDYFNKLVILIGMVGFLSPAYAGTVITVNLPSNTAIVNINAMQDGAAAYSGVNAALWYQPFFTGGATQLLEYTVQPGTYSIRVINPADAVALYPSLNSTQTNQIFTGWTFNSPWVTDYLVFDSSASMSNTVPQLFDGAFSNTNGTWYYYASAAAAYGAAVTGGFFDLIRSGSDGRNGNNGFNGTIVSTTYTFASSKTLIFAVPDYYLPDNGGGVSVLISPVTSKPVLSILAGTGVVTLFWPANFTGFNLSQTTDLSPMAWSGVTNQPMIVNSNFSVTLPLNSTNRFFRLQNP